MTVLSRIGYIGLGKEGTPGVYATPTFYMPATNIAAQDVYTEIRDESYRNNDTVLQGDYQGPAESQLGWDIMGYPDALPYLLRAIVGPDTVTPGVSTTLSANSIVGTASIQVAASITTGSQIQIQDTGGANLEYAITGAPSGTGPYTIPITTPTGGLKYAHTSPTCTVISTASHKFAQSPAAAQSSWSITKYDVATNSGSPQTHARGFPGCKLSELGIKIDPKAALTLAPKWIGFPSAPVTDPTPTFSSAQPMLGWQWAMNNAGASSTRGLTCDLTVKRATEAIHASNGAQAPREVFQGPLEVDGTYKAIFENDNDLNLYLQYSQLPASAVLTQPALIGGSVLTLTLSKSGWHKGAVDMTGVYVADSFDLSGIFNSTDGGAMTATVTNYQQAGY